MEAPKRTGPETPEYSDISRIRPASNSPIRFGSKAALATCVLPYAPIKGPSPYSSSSGFIYICILSFMRQFDRESFDASSTTAFIYRSEEPLIPLSAFARRPMLLCFLDGSARSSEHPHRRTTHPQSIGINPVRLRPQAVLGHPCLFALNHIPYQIDGAVSWRENK